MNYSLEIIIREIREEGIHTDDDIIKKLAWERAFERFKELITKEGEHTDHECATIVTWAYYFRRKFENVPEVLNIISKAENKVHMNFRELMESYNDHNGNYIKALHPYHVDYYSSIEGTLNNKLKS